ncbi:Vps52 / Sac2 family protein [Cardiosporidium cionae]|uniref:Vps52 / Sac2 family protein n=1 Tax=Cardiosporidium cionae TaxID=476202 RepID=A0ABQ7JDQ2_9APIC|nr:Vps52 / Sac2 family protein [Cardiosporidium cionae]|eukprot:KAF8822156.1 Vps52 / Sac2 family protein [Cardiosporidium cionae]
MSLLQDLERSVPALAPKVTAKQLFDIDFQQLDDSWNRFSLDSRVREALSGLPSSKENRTDSVTEDANSPFGSCVTQIDENLMFFESQSVEDYVKSCKELLLLHRNIQASDSILVEMENRIASFQTCLADISQKIKKLQNDSIDMSVKVSNRKISCELFSTYIQQILVTPSLIYAINENDLDEHYCNHLDSLTKKLEHAAQSGIKDMPSAKASIPELEKLKIRAVSRIRDCLADKILLFKKPQSNIQSIQRNSLIKVKKFFQFLMDHHPQAGWDIRQLYVTTLNRIYLNQFKIYTQNLSKMQIENVASSNDYLGSKDVGGKAPSNQSKGMIGAVFGLGGPPAPSVQKGNVYGLAGRDSLLTHLDDDPIVFTAPGKALKRNKFYYEQLFRSHQKLLLDTASSEYLFLTDFFLSAGVEQYQSLFTDVFGKTILYFLEMMETFLFSCYDSVGLLLMAKVNEFNRLTMQRRRVPCLDAYLDRIQALIWPRLKFILDANIQSLKNASPRQLMEISSSQRMHPHYVTRRYAELACSLSALSVPMDGSTPDEPLFHSWTAMRVAIGDLLELLSKELKREERLVFIINNYDLILSIFSEKKLPQDLSTSFEKKLHHQMSLYVDEQLARMFDWLISFVKNAEVFIESNKTLTTDELATELGVEKMENLVLQFKTVWKKRLKDIQTIVMGDFTNFTNGMEILKQVLTQVLLYYTRFQQIITKCYPRQPQPLWTRDIIPTNVILTEYNFLSENQKFLSMENGDMLVCL